MTTLTYFLTKSSNKCNWPSFCVGIFRPILYMLKYINRHPIDYNIFNLSNANTKPEVLASNNQIREYRRETKEINYTIKILKTRYSFIHLPTNFEAETLVLSF